MYSDLQEIYHISERAAALPRQLLLFSRNQPVDLIPLNMNLTIEDMTKMLDRLLGAEISLSMVQGSYLLMVKADKGTWSRS